MYFYIEFMSIRLDQSIQSSKEVPNPAPLIFPLERYQALSLMLNIFNCVLKSGIMKRKIYVVAFLLSFLLAIRPAKAQTGAALDFDGTDDRVNLPFVISGSYTKEAWINSNSLASNNNIISGNATAFWAPALYGSKLSAGHGGGFNDVQDPTPLVANTWYHVAVTYDAGTGNMVLYKNGVQVASASSVPGYTETALYIGAFSGSYNFSGMIDEVRIWNVVRSAAEIAGSMNCELTGDEPGLLAYYNFNQGVAGANNSGLTTLNDMSDKCTPANGTLVNFALTGSTSNWVAPGPTLSGTCANSFANISVSGNSVCIPNGNVTTSLADYTDFGDYGNVALTRTYTIDNTGNATLNISSVTIGGANASDFTVTVNPSATVAGGASTTFTVQFLPSGSLGIKTATITINNDDGDEGTFTYAIQGNYAGQGKSLQFDGVGDRVDIPNLIPSGNYTIEALIYSNNAPLGNNIVSGTINGSALWAPSPGFQLTAGHAPTFDQVVDPTPLTANTWYHVAVTYDAITGDMKLYKDGVQVASASGVPNFTNTAMYIGAFNGGFFWQGNIDEVRIWNVVRSSTEINNNKYCKLTGDEPGLLAYYDFTAGIAGVNNAGENTLFDRAKKCIPNNGTLVNFTLNGTSSNWVSDSLTLTGACSATYPNAEVSGNGNCIILGDATPSPTDNTDFGTYFAPGIDKVFTITNTGSATLNISSINISGTDASMFSILSAPGTLVLAPGASTNFTIRFIGSGSDGIKTATITVNNDDPDEGAYAFAIQGNFQIALPVTFEYFRGRIDASTVKLNWKTAIELNNAGFEIQRSANGNNGWEKIGYVAAVRSGTANAYDFTDLAPMQGLNVYRLKQIDNNGNYKFSGSVSLNFTGKAAQISYYPNPVRNQLQLQISDSKLLNTPVQISTVTGKILSVQTIITSQQTIDMSTLPPGMYMLSFSNGEVKKIVKQ